MKHIKLFENFDKYEFGRIYKDLNSASINIGKNAINMSEDDIDIIKKEFGNEYYANCRLISCPSGEKIGAIVAPSVIPRLMNCAYILSMGDYIYGVIYYERETTIRRTEEKITKVFVCDDMDDVLDCLRNNLWKIDN